MGRKRRRRGRRKPPASRTLVVYCSEDLFHELVDMAAIYGMPTAAMSRALVQSGMEQAKEKGGLNLPMLPEESAAFFKHQQAAITQIRKSHRVKLEADIFANSDVRSSFKVKSSPPEIEPIVLPPDETISNGF